MTHLKLMFLEYWLLIPEIVKEWLCNISDVGRQIFKVVELLTFLFSFQQRVIDSHCYSPKLGLQLLKHISIPKPIKSYCNIFIVHDMSSLKVICNKLWQAFSRIWIVLFHLQIEVASNYQYTLSCLISTFDNWDLSKKANTMSFHTRSCSTKILYVL